MKKFGKRMILIICIVCTTALSANAQQLLIPGGQVVGIHLTDGTVCVAAIDQELGAAARSAGLQVGDQIVSIDAHAIHDPAQVRKALQCSDGDVEVSVLRGGKTKKITFCPPATADGPRLGVYLREGTTGIGTVTYYDPSGSRFGALGHGVNDPAGKLLNMTGGSIYPASVLSVRKGKCGSPGQLLGTLTDTASLGVIGKNTAQGVFGSTPAISAEPLPAGSKGDVKTGSATIRSTINSGAPQDYSVKILKIYPGGGNSGRNMLIEVTDERLLSSTGGIVQGMSGSPIIQNGKLIGAVTHVLVNDPTTGYGIFIENMLGAAA